MLAAAPPLPALLWPAADAPAPAGAFWEDDDGPWAPSAAAGAVLLLLWCAVVSGLLGLLLLW